MLLYVPEDSQNAVRTAMTKYKEVPFKVDYQGSRIIFVD